jgi:CheY-like chemotaxis protein
VTERRILLIDDEPEIRMLCRINLEMTGWSVEEHGRGDGAVEAVRATAPDVVVLDLRMPGRSGWEVLADLKADPELAIVPVILLTADAGGPHGRGYEPLRPEPGLLEVLEKPFHPHDLVDMVERAATATVPAALAEEHRLEVVRVLAEGIP